MLELTNVGFDYGSLTVIDGLDLAVAANELVVCVGPSGCVAVTFITTADASAGTPATPAIGSVQYGQPQYFYGSSSGSAPGTGSSGGSSGSTRH